jgi:hypothetical protein
LIKKCPKIPFILRGPFFHLIESKKEKTMCPMCLCVHKKSPTNVIDGAKVEKAFTIRNKEFGKRKWA